MPDGWVGALWPGLTNNEVRHYGQYQQHQYCTIDKVQGKQTEHQSHGDSEDAESGMPTVRTSWGRPRKILPAQPWPKGRQLAPSFVNS